MCYEQRFFKSWAKQKARQAREIKPEERRAHPDVQPIRPAPKHEITRGKVVEREYEEIV